MSLLVIATVSAVVALSAGYLARTRTGSTAPSRKLPPSRPEASPPSASIPGISLSLGDVISFNREERWLSGALIASDRGKVIAVVWIAPEGIKREAVVSFPEPDRFVYWLEPAAVACAAEPPATLEIAGSVLRRRSRLPVTLKRIGQEAPEMGDSGIFAIYEGVGREVAVVMASLGCVQAWSGRRVDADEYERLGEGGLAEEEDPLLNE